jgi:phosphoribosylformylglycinamidine cyclo-ligase
VPQDMDQPVLVSSADGVGTKLKAAFLSNTHNTVGQDLINHCVNDILCTGARPLFFLDYMAVGKLEHGVVESLIEGLAIACRQSGCALIGGETAEMPDFYSPGEYDLAGTIIGVLEKDKALLSENVKPGDLLLTIPSSGCHTNGYSLVRKILFDHLGLKIDDYVEELGCTVGEEMLKIHRCYGQQLAQPIEDGLIKSLAHITGGGITDNLPRSIPENCDAAVKRGSWPVLPVFQFLQEKGNVDVDEMHHVFNMGAGIIAVIAPENIAAVEKHLSEQGETTYRIGEIVEGSGEVRYV